MPYKVNRFSNNNSKGAGRRGESPVVESPIVESPIVESPVVESPVVESPVLDPLVEETLDVSPAEETFDVPLNEEQSLFPMFNDDFSKVFNPQSNRYVKVGGDIDKKFNLSKRY